MSSSYIMQFCFALGLLYCTIANHFNIGKSFKHRYICIIYEGLIQGLAHFLAKSCRPRKIKSLLTYSFVFSAQLPAKPKGYSCNLWGALLPFVPKSNIYLSCWWISAFGVFLFIIA